MYVGHETNTASDLLGDGGGATIIEVKKEKGHWKSIGKKYNVDFSAVGGTYDNCSGAYTAKGTILSAEEFPPESNVELFKKGKGTRDTSDLNGLKRWQQMGWMVEVDPVSKKALSKLYSMGRFSHEAALVMPDNKTVYLTDDYKPSVFFKFIAEKENEFSKGQLYAYKQSADEKSGSWISLPMEMDSLVIIREVAIRMGATMFVRMEWLTLVDGKIYISETGADDFSLDTHIRSGGFPASHIAENKTDKGHDYPYGALLVFDPESNEMKALIKGGKGKKDPSKHFSNPDGIAYGIVHGKKYLVINEDLVGNTKGRTNEEGEKTGKYTNEIWWLDLSIPNPTIDDLQRFLTAPVGSETTGGYFTPDGSTYFVNIQHPDKGNHPPFNKSVTIAITGFDKKR